MNLIEAFLTEENLRSLGISYHPAYQRRLERWGAFPRRVKIAKATYVWPRAEIEDYLARRMRERHDPKARLRRRRKIEAVKRLRRRRASAMKSLPVQTVNRVSASCAE